MPEPLSDSEKREIRARYVERYKRIKDERKIILNTLIGLSGGSIVLSITFLDKIAPHKRLLPLIILAWCLFGLTLLLSVNELITMIRRSQSLQRKLNRQLNDDEELNTLTKKEELRAELEPVSEPPFLPFYLVAEYLAGIFFGLAVLALAVFVITNLVAG